jgi:hypothetical protein
MIDVNNCRTHFALSENQGSRLDGSSDILGPRGNNYPPPTPGCGKNPPQTHLTLSQLESNIRKKLSPAEANNIVLAASPQNG